MCLVNIPYIDKNEAAEMFQLLFDTRLFKFTADAPQCNPLLELPPTIARESSKQGTARTPNPLIKMDTLFTSGLCEGGRSPSTSSRPLCGRLFARKGSPEGPVGIGNETAQNHARTAAKETIVAAAADKRIIYLTGIKPTAIASVRCLAS